MLIAVVSIRVNRVPSLIFFYIFNKNIHLSEKSYFKPNLISKLKEWSQTYRKRDR